MFSPRLLPVQLAEYKPNSNPIDMLYPLENTLLTANNSQQQHVSHLR
jgi:hypothetical protein